MIESSEEESFILASLRLDSDDVMELPLETDGTVLLTTVQAQFPAAVGLKYKSSTGGWRGIKVDNNVCAPPNNGWGIRRYIVTESDALKSTPADELDEDRPVGSKGGKRSRNDDYAPRSKTAKLLDDLIVLGLPYSATEEILKEYFTTACGELEFCQVKMDRASGKSRGFGFIRFKTVEGAEKAMKESHKIDGRKLVVRMSQREGDIPTKLYVGRIPEGTTEEDVKSYFSEFGELVDLFCPNPCRGFAFITYAEEDDAKNVLKGVHTINGRKIMVKAAEAKSKRDHDQEQEGSWNRENEPWTNSGSQLLPQRASSNNNYYYNNRGSESQPQSGRGSVGGSGRSYERGRGEFDGSHSGGRDARGGQGYPSDISDLVSLMGSAGYRGPGRVPGRMADDVANRVGNLLLNFIGGHT